MKARLTLPERPSALHLLVVVDILVVLLVFFTLIPAVAPQAGMRVELAEISSRLSNIDFDRTVALTIKRGPPPQFYLETQRIAFEDLESALIEAREKSGTKSVIVTADKKVDWEVASQLTRVIASAGLTADSYWVGVPPSGPTTTPTKPSSTSGPPADNDAPQP